MLLAGDQRTRGPAARRMTRNCSTVRWPAGKPTLALPRAERLRYSPTDTGSERKLLFHANAGGLSSRLLGKATVGNKRGAAARHQERASLAGEAGEVIPARRLGDYQRAETFFAELFEQCTAALSEWSRHKRIEETVVSSIWT